MTPADATRTRLLVRAYNGAQHAVGRLGPGPGGFAGSEDALLEAARREAGLDDFGDAHFLDGLRVLLGAYDEEAHLTPFGRMMVRSELAGILRSRLDVQAGLGRNPQLTGAAVPRPIFILGLPRTGTTALHHLLARDPANQVLEYWLAAAPRPRPPVAGWRREPRYREARRALRLMYYLDPSLKAIHLMTAEGPDECRHLLQESFVDDTFECNASIPRYSAWYARQDMRFAYEHHRDVLNLIGSPQPERRWVLKYPAHMRHLRALLQVYPDACFVQTHRDPARVLPSLCSLVSGWRGLYEGSVDREEVSRWLLELWSSTLLDALLVRRTREPAQFFDLHLRDVASDPVGCVKRLYGHFGFDWSPEAERSMRAWHAQNPQAKQGEHRYSPEQFGLTSRAIRESFAPYLEQFQIPEERGDAMH